MHFWLLWHFGIYLGLCTQTFCLWITGELKWFYKVIFYIPNIETILAFSPKISRNFKNLIEKIFLRDICWNPSKKKEVKVLATWSDNKHHNTFNFSTCIIPNSSITLPKVYTRKTSYKAVILQFCSLYVLPNYIY